MAVFETWLACDLQEPLKPQVLDGAMFTQDNLGNKIGVVLTNGGVDENIVGTVSGSIIRSDGTTVSIASGSSDGNRAWIVLPQAAYAVTGQIVIVIKLTNESVITTIGCAVAFVQKSATGAIVDPGTIISDIDTLIATIAAAVDSIPVDLTSLMESIAPIFSASETYAVGDYVWRSTGVDSVATLYKFTTAHPAGNWNSSHVISATLSDDIKNIQHIYTPVTGKPTSNLMPTFGGTVTLSQITQNANGQIAATNRTLTIPSTAASSGAAGLMSAADKSKLDAMETVHYGESSTAAGTQTKTVTISGVTALSDGMSVTVKFTYAQEYNGTPKLNLNNRGAKNIQRTASGNAAGAGEWAAGAVLCFVYNASADCWVIQNGQDATAYTYGKTLMDESVDGDTDVVRALSSRVFFNTYVRDLITDAEVYDPENTYAVGTIVRNFGAMFRCKTSISTPEAWDVSHWERIPAIQAEIDQQRFDYNESMRNILTGADPYNTTQAYAVGSYCIYGNTLYKCTTAIPSGEAWNSAHWEDQSNFFWTLQETKDKVDGGVGARNLLLDSANPAIHNFNSTGFTVTRNVSVTEWGANDATEVSGTGGTNHVAFYIGGLADDMAYGQNVGINGQHYTTSVWIKNNHATNNCQVRTNILYAPGYTVIEPGQSVRVIQTVTGNGDQLLNFNFSTVTAGKAFDIILWHPQIEIGTFATDWRPAPEDTPSLIPLASSGAQGTNGLMSRTDKAILEELYYDEAYEVNSFKSSAISSATGLIRKIGYTVCIDFKAILAQQVAGLNEVEIMTLPTGYWPVSDVYFMAVGDYASSVIFFGAVVYAATGRVCAKAKTSLASGKSLHGSVTFFLPGGM